MKRIFWVSVLLLASACAARRPRPAPPPPPPGGPVEEGFASWYGVEEKGRQTASGEIMDPERFTAAHRRLPFGSVVRVDDLDTGRSVVVVVNDRGPSVSGRIIDLSHGAARALGMVERGVARVRIRVLGEDPTGYTWRVQVGAFAEEERARQAAQTLLQSGHHPVVVQAEEQRLRTFFKVWVGEFRDRAGADQLADRLRREGWSAFVLSTRAEP